MTLHGCVDSAIRVTASWNSREERQRSRIENDTGSHIASDDQCATIKNGKATKQLIWMSVSQWVLGPTGSEGQTSEDSADDVHAEGKNVGLI